MFDWTPANVTALSRLVAERLSAGQAAHRMGVSRSTVIGKARRLGLQFNSGANGGGVPKGTIIRTRLNRDQPPRSRPPKPQPVEQTVEPVALGPLNAFPEDYKSCRWIHGDVRQGEWQCCGHPGFPWCAHHKARLRVAGSAVRSGKETSWAAKRRAA